MENWRPIEATNGMIEVSDLGNVRSLLKHQPKKLKTQTDNKGYQRVCVTIAGKKMHFKVHREVAKAFIPNSHNLPQVNHIDGNKNNNAVSNLEWISNRDNAHHAIVNGLWRNVFEASRKTNESRKKPVIAYKVGESPLNAKYFESISDAERAFDSRHISDVLKGRRSQVKGFSFAYAEGGDTYEDTINRPAER